MTAPASREGRPVNTKGLLWALAQTGCAGQVGTQLPPRRHALAAKSSEPSISAEAGLRVPRRGEAASPAPCCPLPLHTRGQPCPPGHTAPALGAGRCLSQERDGTVTLGSSSRSPRPTDLVRHLPLPQVWERLCSPAARPRRAVCATAGKGAHGSWPQGFGMVLRRPAWDLGILRLSGNLFC